MLPVISFPSSIIAVSLSTGIHTNWSYVFWIVSVSLQSAILSSFVIYITSPSSTLSYSPGIFDIVAPPGIVIAYSPITISVSVS